MRTRAFRNVRQTARQMVRDGAQLGNAYYSVGPLVQLRAFRIQDARLRVQQAQLKGMDVSARLGLYGFDRDPPWRSLRTQRARPMCPGS